MLLAKLEIDKKSNESLTNQINKLLGVSAYQLEQVVERTARDLDLRKRESGRLGVLEARKLSNPILRPIGRSVG